ncbi:hypothetical protein [Streptomyces sp. NPDC018693]|uniref:hypothetical protein n=1 Tax=unclassified Streptomyces TaxID=2593676 RepID=UPI0037AA80C2
MSGCGCGQPIITSAPAVPRVDVETLLLCDVLADGTVAGLVLVEPVYDTSSGARVATRTVDPATGADYTVQGTLTDCAATDGDCDQFIGALCYQEPTTQYPSFTLHKFNDADPNHPGCLVGLDALDGDLPFIQYNDPITAWEGVYTSNTGTASNVEVSAPELGGFIDWSTFSPPIPSVPNAGIPAPYTGTAVFNGVTVTLDVFTASAITTGSQYLRMGGTEHFKLSFSSPVTMKFGTQGFADPAAGNDERFCNVTATGVVTGAGEIRTAFGLRDCTTGEMTWRDQVTGDEVDLTQAVVVPCPQQQDCASPTEPTATVGLCLADGTPIAVTVIRDCAGTVTSEGWLNLTTGAYSAGAPPAGTVACGDSRSIQVSGTFCDIDPATGDVLGLVLIEYTYDDTGAIASVRLVDAVTGDTYTPTGTVTTCPAGVEQPEQDAVVLCDTAADGTVTQFLRDFRRDENGTISGHSDYLLDGTAYTPAGTVGVCAPPCLNCETVTLCDSTANCAPASAADADWSPRYLTAADTAAPGVIALRKDVPGGGSAFWSGGSTVFPNVAADPDGGNDGVHYGIAGVVTAADFCPECIGPDDQVTITASGQAHNDGPGGGILTDGRWRILRDGGEANGAVPQLAQTTDSNRPTGSTWSFTATATVPWSDVLAGRIVLTLDLETRSNGAYKQWTASAFELCITPVTPAAGCGNTFRRTICRDCSGAIVSTTDYETDGVTPYTPVGAVGECVACTPPEVDACQHCETVLLCDEGADDPATITGQGVSSGTLSNGITWASKITSAVPSRLTNADGAWWNSTYAFPNPNIGPQTWTFNRPVDVEFSVYIQYAGTAFPTNNQVQLPAGVEPVALPTGFTYDAATRILTVDGTADQTCTNLTAPRKATSARFRTVDPVTSLTLQFLGIRIASCGQFGNWAFGAFEVVPPGQFLRTICRDCDGTVTSVTDTTLDGQTPYTLVGNPKQCQPQTCGGCETQQLCGPVERVVNGKFGGGTSGWTLTGNVAYDGTDPDASGGAGFLVYSQSEATPDGVASQTVTATAGKTYTFSARVGTRGSANAAALLVEVLSAGGTVLYSQTVTLPAGSTAWPAAGVVGPVDVRATDGTLTLRFTDKTVNTASTDVALDNVSLLETVSFLRTMCRNCDGTVTSVTDTKFDGTTPVTVAGEAHTCAPDTRHCETLTLCDFTPGTDRWAMVGAGESSLWGPGPNSSSRTATLDNGIAVTATSASGGILAGNVYPDTNGISMLASTAGARVTFSPSKPAQLRFVASLRPNAAYTLPVGAVIERLGTNHTYDPATRILAANASADWGGDQTANDQTANSTQVYVPVTTAAVPATVTNAGPTGSGILFDNLQASPADAQTFLRVICRDETGKVLSVTDTTLDGTTPYVPQGLVGDCSGGNDCCQPEQVCIQQDPQQRIEFISNEGQVYDGTVDPVWKWTPDTNGLPLNDPNFGPAVNASWYDMYRPSSYPTTRWTITDTDTNRPAGWITPHPDSGVAQSTPPRPGEGPAVPGNADWIGRAQFTLPAGADPDSIQIQVTVLNADQYTTGFRLNSGPWQAIPDGGFNPTDPPNNGLGVPYTFGPGQIPGAQPGVNTLYMRVHETVGGAAGVIAHMIATYTIARPEQRSWTRMVCCDGSVYYLDEDGAEQASLPEGWSVIPCGAVTSAPVVLCDDNGSFLRHVSYFPDGTMSVLDTDLLGAAYNPAGTVHACAGTTATVADQPVMTGIARYTNDGSLVDLKGTYPGLQSVTLTVLSGLVATGMSNTGASGVPIPAGLTMTWSVGDADDSSLDKALFQQQGNADYLLNWTYKGTAAG